MNLTAITGIDGSGKSTIIQQLHRDYGSPTGVRFLACPSYHDLPGSGVDELSLLFARINQLGNENRHPDLKALGLFLQMSLYQPALHNLTAQGATRIIAERHAIVDTVIYGSIYRKRIAGSIDPIEWESRLKTELNHVVEDGFNKVADWISGLKLGQSADLSFWNVTQQLGVVFSAQPQQLMAALSHAFSLPLPDTLLFLKTDPGVAVERLKRGNQQLEIHETTTILDRLQQGYLHLLHQLRHHPEIEVLIVENGDIQVLRQRLSLLPTT